MSTQQNESLAEEWRLPDQDADLCTRIIPVRSRPAQLRALNAALGAGSSLDQDQETLSATEFLAEPFAIAPTPRNASHFAVLQKWEGRVVARLADSFSAVLTDMTDTSIEEEAELGMAEVSKDDQPLVEPGAIFYWSVGYRVEPTGTISRSSVVRFRRLPCWSQQDLRRVADRVADLKRRLHW